jgi:excisionase family DNA binding protein
MGVYAITNLRTGAAYIGASVDVQRRFRGHLRQLEAGTHRVPGLQVDWLTHGPAAFALELLEAVPAARDLRDREQVRLTAARARGATYNAPRSAPYALRQPPPAAVIDDPFLNVREVALRLGRTPETVRRWIRAGTLAAVSMGSDAGGYRVRDSEVRRVEAGM